MLLVNHLNALIPLHSHHTAEVFIVLSQRWRFFWGQQGDAGEVLLEAGDIINIPTNVFRGFENVGNDYGMILSVLGGNDSGGGVIWAPEVIEAAKSYGLTLGDNGVLYDQKNNENLPDGVAAVQQLQGDVLQSFSRTRCDNIYPPLCCSLSRYACGCATGTLSSSWQ